MKFIYTNGLNQDFIELCSLLDAYLNELAEGEENRKQYIPLNNPEDISDVVLIYEEGLAIGCAGFKHYGNDTAEVKRVFIREDYRGKGLSKQLMDYLERHAKEKGIRKLILETGEPLVEAMELYRKIGYVITENYLYYENKPDSICMKKLL